MLVESLWKNFKQMVLHHYNCPCMDFATCALVTEGIASYQVCLNHIVRNPCNGCAKGLHGEQIPIKHAWLACHKCPLNGSYNTDVKLWLCSCRSQKYHAYLLCKHLVQALPLPDADWWTNIVWQHTPPFYNIRKLPPQGKQETAPSPAVLGLQYWTRQDTALLQTFLASHCVT